jgi:organic radical activating enzyme
MHNESKIKKISDFTLTDQPPYLSQTFYSLEGEGMTVGRAALFLRINGCNASCTFCDTAFSIPGNPKYNIVNMIEPDFETFLKKEYSLLEKEDVDSVTITGGEPLKNIKQYNQMFRYIFKVFPNVKNVIFETNGTYLKPVENCLLLLKELGEYIDKGITFTLSISPKLSGKLSWKNISDNEVLSWYVDILHNYKFYLKRQLDIQMKFIHFPTDSEYYTLNHNLLSLCIDSGIEKSKILIMPFTPPEPLGIDSTKWTESKNNAARYALSNHFRYSPRIHIDRRLE